MVDKVTESQGERTHKKFEISNTKLKNYLQFLHSVNAIRALHLLQSLINKPRV